jgi:inner membrane protein
MDPVSQAVLGASCAQSVSRRRHLGAATVVGVIAGMAPDVDVLISSSTDPLLFLEYHRHFTHSLAFIPVGALVCAAICHPFVRKRLSFLATYLFALLGYATHGLLDACTTYGTMLLWPFADTRVAWNNVSVVDPLFTVPVFALVALSYKRKSSWLGRAALTWAVAYLLIGVWQNHRAADAGRELALGRGHVPVRAVAMPSIANLWLWRHVYEYDGNYYVDAIRVGTGTRIFAGSSVAKLDPTRQFPWLDASSTQAEDIRRFRHFADDFLGLDANVPNRIVDLRYSPLPDQVAGIWGIELDPEAPPGAHVRFETNRDVALSQAGHLFEMLFD